MHLVTQNLERGLRCGKRGRLGVIDDANPIAFTQELHAVRKGLELGKPLFNDGGFHLEVGHHRGNEGGGRTEYLVVEDAFHLDRKVAMDNGTVVEAPGVPRFGAKGFHGNALRNAQDGDFFGQEGGGFPCDLRLEDFVLEGRVGFQGVMAIEVIGLNVEDCGQRWGKGAGVFQLEGGDLGDSNDAFASVGQFQDAGAERNAVVACDGGRHVGQGQDVRHALDD